MLPWVDRRVFPFQHSPVYLFWNTFRWKYHVEQPNLVKPSETNLSECSPTLKRYSETALIGWPSNSRQWLLLEQLGQIHGVNICLCVQWE